MHHNRSGRGFAAVVLALGLFGLAACRARSDEDAARAAAMAATAPAVEAKEADPHVIEMPQTGGPAPPTGRSFVPLGLGLLVGFIVAIVWRRRSLTPSAKPVPSISGSMAQPDATQLAALLSHADQLISKGQPGNAVVVLEHALGLIRGSAEEPVVKLRLARARIAQGQLPAAEALLDETQQLPELAAGSAFLRGQIAQQKGEISEAADYYRAALDLDPALDDARHSLGQLEYVPASAWSRESKSRDASYAALVHATGSAGWYPAIKRMAAEGDVVSQEIVNSAARVRRRKRPRLRAFLGPLVLWIPLLVVIPPAFVALGRMASPPAALLAIAVLWPTTMLCVALCIRARRLVIENGALILQHGLFWKSRRLHEIFRIVEVDITRTPLNLVTGDASLVLKFGFGHGATLKLRGMGNARELERLQLELRTMATSLRAHPVIKGIIQ